MKKITYVNPPDRCDICQEEIDENFYDAKTISGPWANMCYDCFNWYGVGLGVGRGQHYQRRPEDGVFEKVEG